MGPSSSKETRSSKHKHNVCIIASNPMEPFVPLSLYYLSVGDQTSKMKPKIQRCRPFSSDISLIFYFVHYFDVTSLRSLQFVLEL
jgi:hypothetical protein